MSLLEAAKAERQQLETQLKKVDRIIRMLSGGVSAPVKRSGARKGHKVSAATKAKLRAAAKARWAKVKAKAAK